MTPRLPIASRSTTRGFPTPLGDEEGLNALSRRRNAASGVRDRRKPGSSFRAGVLALVVGLAGCGLETAGGGGTVNTCATDAECGSGEICGAEGLCLSEDGARLRLTLAITAPGGGSNGETLRYATPPFDFVPGNTGPVTLPRPLTVAGQVRTPGGRRISAELFFNRRGPDVPEVRRQVRASTFADEQEIAGLGMPMDYAVELTEGVSYDVVVEPRGSDLFALPPLRSSEPVSFTDGAGDDRRDGSVAFDMTYPNGELATASGRVVDPEGRPVDCVEVFAVSRGSGARVSSVAVTGPGACPGVPDDLEGRDELPPGGYRLAVDPAVPDVLLRLVPPEPLPQLTFDPIYAPPDFETVIGLPDLAEVTYGGRVENADGVPVPNAVVTFRASSIASETAGTVGAFEATVRTDDAGGFELVLFAGDYEVIVQAAASADTGILEQDVSIGDDMDGAPIRGQVFVLPDRATLRGMVRTSGGAPVTGTRVEARPLNTVVPVQEVTAFTPSAAFNRSADPQVTGDDGAFALRLDEGAYDLVLEPAQGSGFPWQRVLQAVGPGEAELGRDLVVPAPVPFRGVVKDHLGDVVPGAQVTAYGEVTDDIGTRLVPVGRATTDADGAYEILLPPGL